jgi:hypothetical protein
MVLRVRTRSRTGQASPGGGGGGGGFGSTVNWNPADKDSLLILAHSNLDAGGIVFDADYHGVRANGYGTTNSYYEWHNFDKNIRFATFGAGIGNLSESLHPSTGGAGTRIGGTNSCVLSDPGNYAGPDGSGNATGAGILTGDVLGFLLKASSIEAYLNGSLLHTFAQLPTGAQLYPIQAIRHDSFHTFANFGQRAFSYPPAGALAWNGNAAATLVDLDPFYSDGSAFLTFSNGNLTATVVTTKRNCCATSTTAHRGSATKRCFEAKIENNGEAFNGDTIIGFSTSVPDFTVDGTHIGGSADSQAYTDRGAMVGAESAVGGTYATATAGDVITAVLNTASCSFYKNGTLIRTTTAALPSNSPNLYPAIQVGDGLRSVTVNFGATAFAFPITGTTSWDGTQTH